MIAVECFPDEALLRAIGVPMARIVHGHGRGNVLNALLQGRVRAGVIDEDPNSGYITQLVSFTVRERMGALHRRRRYDILPKYGDFLRALLSVDQEMQTLRRWVLTK